MWACPPSGIMTTGMSRLSISQFGLCRCLRQCPLRIWVLRSGVVPPLWSLFLLGSNSTDCRRFDGVAIVVTLTFLFRFLLSRPRIFFSLVVTYSGYDCIIKSTLQTKSLISYPHSESLSRSSSDKKMSDLLEMWWSSSVYFRSSSPIGNPSSSIGTDMFCTPKSSQ